MNLNESLEDRFFPVATVPKTNQVAKPAESPSVIKKIIQGAIQGAYQKKLPSDYELNYGNPTPMPEEQIQFVTHLIESLQPQDAIEAALASQFVITYVQGLKSSIDHSTRMMELFGFGHQVLETLTKYRTKGAQLINVQYNHNQGQIVNIKNIKESNPQSNIEGN